MNLQRRLTLYLFGIVIGAGLAWQFYGERLTNSGWLPQEKIKLRLRTTLVATTGTAAQQLAAWPADMADVRASIDSAAIDLKGSERTEDSIHYAVYTRLAGKPVHYTVSVLRDFDRDTTAVLRSIAGIVDQP